MSMTKPIIVHQTAVPWQAWDSAENVPESAIRWKILISSEKESSNGLVTGLAELPVGARLPLHHHEPDESYYVVSGRGKVEIDGHEAEIGPGSAMYVPSNAKHAVQCTGEEPLVFVFTFACNRFDKITYHFDE